MTQKNRKEWPKKRKENGSKREKIIVQNVMKRRCHRNVRINFFTIGSSKALGPPARSNYVVRRLLLLVNARTYVIRHFMGRYIFMRFVNGREGTRGCRVWVSVFARRAGISARWGGKAPIYLVI